VAMLSDHTVHSRVRAVPWAFTTVALSFPSQDAGEPTQWSTHSRLVKCVSLEIWEVQWVYHIIICSMNISCAVNFRQVCLSARTFLLLCIQVWVPKALLDGPTNYCAPLFTTAHLHQGPYAPFILSSPRFSSRET
jgi:hypothetical protein